MHIQTHSANMHQCSSAFHFALGYSLKEQASEPWSEAVTSCSEHALCFVSRGGVVGAQGMLNHKNAEYLSPVPVPPPPFKSAVQLEWNTTRLSNIFVFNLIYF